MVNGAVERAVAPDRSSAPHEVAAGDGLGNIEDGGDVCADDRGAAMIGAPVRILRIFDRAMVGFICRGRTTEEIWLLPAVVTVVCKTLLSMLLGLNLLGI